MFIHVSWCTWAHISLGIASQKDALGHKVWRSLTVVFQDVCTILCSHQHQWEFPLLHISPTLGISGFNFSYSGVCNAIPWWFYFPFTWWLMKLSTFSHIYWPFVFPFHEEWVEILCWFFFWIVYLFLINLKEPFTYSGY